MKEIQPPKEVETTQEKVQRFMAGMKPPKSVTTESSSCQQSRSTWFKFSEEQTAHLISLTSDMIENDTVKREVVWKRVEEDPKSWELGLISKYDTEEQAHKQKQRLRDKVRKETLKRKMAANRY